MTIAFKAIRSSGPMIDARATEAALRRNMKVYCDILIKELREDYNRVPEGPNYVRKYRGGGSATAWRAGSGLGRRRHPRARLATDAGGLGGHWRSSVSGNGQTGNVWNDVSYAKYVQGHLGQQSMNNLEAGWRSIDTVVRQTRPVFNKLMKDSIEVGVAKARRERNRLGQFV